MSRLFQTKHHTLALAPYGGILLILFFSMLCLSRSRSVSHGFLSVVDFLYLHSHLFYLHPYSFLFSLCVLDVFQLTITLFFIIFFVWGFTFFFVIFASRMKTLSCTFVCSGAHAYFDSNTFTSTVSSIASMSDALSDTSGTTPSHKGNLLFLLSSSFFWTSSGVFSLNL